MGQDKRSATHGTRDIVCPFFKMHSAKEIVCEGIVTGTLRKGEGSLNVVAFINQDVKQVYQQGFCEREYKKCPYYRMLMNKYEEQQ